MSAKPVALAGMFYAVAAYTMWGIAPLYFKQITEVPPTDILMHRVIWSALLLCVLLVVLKQIGKMKAIFASKKLMLSLAAASVLLGANWLLFIWAINSNYMLEASLGYYINPIINVFLGRLILQERLRPLQKFAVLLAIAGVVNIIVAHGTLPWIALTLACTFSVYGLIRKQIPVEPMPGLFMETLVLLPFAILYWAMFAGEQSNMLTNDWELNGWLLAAGVVTTMPLLAFNAAAKRILFTTLGLFQYIGPTLMFILAVWLYQEPLEPARLTTFALVWVGLLLFSIDAWRGFKKQRKVVAAVTE